jgi:hypothetical protein
MDKQSAAQFSQVLADVPTALRSLAAERDHYRTKCASMQRRHEAEKLAKVAHDKGVYLDHEQDELADHFEKEAAAGNLPEIRRALDMVAPNMSMKLAHVSDERSVGADSSDFERYIHGEIG